VGNRYALHKSKMPMFKTYLDSKGIAHRPGSGTCQELQVLTPKSGWQCVYNKFDAPEHLYIQDALMPVIKAFSIDYLATI